ncbi:thiopeptide-type bacteriocin biosynthesis protein [Tenacibaculum ovolyticum]|uniref:thiopeptide-type bacteriocin biosynthesis protein n=1 Tax=Tenacibaculum ovolyticum TaxID=104270 RepID=UPI003BAC09FA
MNKETNWISCYIFHNSSFEKILIELIAPIINKLEEAKLIEHSFFIRYWENGPHIRLRVLPTKTNVKIKKLIKQLIDDYFTIAFNETKYSIEFNNYIQEIGRYGGTSTIKISENHFQSSSQTVLTCITNNYDNWDYSKAISIAIQMHIVLIKQIFNNLDEVILFFNTFYNNWIQCSIKLDQGNQITTEEIVKVNNLFNSSYKRQKESVDFIVKKLWFTEQYEDSWLSDWSIKSKITSKQIIETKESFIIKEIVFNETLKVNKEKQILFTLYESYIHMTNNRLGIHLRDEPFIAFLIFNALESIVEK